MQEKLVFAALAAFLVATCCVPLIYSKPMGDINMSDHPQVDPNKQVQQQQQATNIAATNSNLINDNKLTQVPARATTGTSARGFGEVYSEPMYQAPMTYSQPSYQASYQPTYQQQTYQQPSYQQPTYQQPSYQQQTYSTPSYQAPTYSTPTYQAPSYTPTYETQVNYTMPSYNSYQTYKSQPVVSVTPSYTPPPVYEQPQMNYTVSTYTTPYQAPSYNYSTPSYSTPSYSTPSYSTPSYSTPSYSTPSYSTPSYSTPSYSTPSYSTPSYSTPNYTTPSYSMPTYSTPSYSTPSYSTPSYSTPSYQQSYQQSYQPTYQAPSYSNYSTPSYSMPTYSTPSYQTPQYSTYNYTQPTYTTPSYTAPTSYQAPTYTSYSTYEVPQQTYSPPVQSYVAPSYTPQVQTSYAPVQQTYVPQQGYGGHSSQSGIAKRSFPDTAPYSTLVDHLTSAATEASATFSNVSNIECPAEPSEYTCPEIITDIRKDQLKEKLCQYETVVTAKINLVPENENSATRCGTIQLIKQDAKSEDESSEMPPKMAVVIGKNCKLDKMLDKNSQHNNGIMERARSNTHSGDKVFFLLKTTIPSGSKLMLVDGVNIDMLSAQAIDEVTLRNTMQQCPKRQQSDDDTSNNNTDDDDDKDKDKDKDQ